MNKQKRNAGKTRKSAHPARLGAHGSPSPPGWGAERDAEEPARSAWLGRVRPAPGSARVPRRRPARRWKRLEDRPRGARQSRRLYLWY